MFYFHSNIHQIHISPSVWNFIELFLAFPRKNDIAPLCAALNILLESVQLDFNSWLLLILQSQQLWLYRRQKERFLSFLNSDLLKQKQRLKFNIFRDFFEISSSFIKDLSAYSKKRWERYVFLQRLYK